MPEYLLHKNGRGRLYGDAEANSNTYISKDSSASGFAKLRDCRLRASEAKDHCQVYGGEFFHSQIVGRTVVAGSPDVFGAILDCSEVSGTPKILGGWLRGTTEVCDSPVIKGMVTCQDAVIYGNPTLWGYFTVTGRVHEGTWTRAPKHIKLPWCDLTECVENKLLLDCRCRTIDYWLRHGAKLARRWDWSEDQIDVTLDAIRREFTDGARHRLVSAGREMEERRLQNTLGG